jgi:hypothetical protein
MKQNMQLTNMQFDFRSATHDFRRVPDIFRNIVQKFEEDATGVAAPGTPDELAATVYTVEEGTTLLIGSIDVEADVETRAILEVSVDNGGSYAGVRQFELASKGQLNLEYRIPFSFTGTAAGANATKVRLSFDQDVAGRMSAGYIGRLIES